MIVLDADIIIAFVNPSDRHHQHAAELLEEHASHGFQMHQLTLAEVLVGAVRTGRGSQLLNDLRSLGIVAHEPGASEPLILAELRVTTGLRVPDCCVLAVAQLENVPLATFDQQLGRAAQKLRIPTVG